MNDFQPRETVDGEPTPLDPSGSRESERGEERETTTLVAEANGMLISVFPDLHGKSARQAKQGRQTKTRRNGVDAAAAGRWTRNPAAMP